MDLTPEQFARLNQWFEEIADLPRDKREALLAKIRAAEGEDIAQQLSCLLDANDGTSNTMSRLLEQFRPSFESKDSTVLRIGENLLGRFRIEGMIGRGGMGVVYKALDLQLNRTVALKFLPSKLAANALRRSAFLNEARAASALDHPNIGTIYEIEEAPDRQPFIVMAYYEGRTLADKIRDGPVKPTEALTICIQIAKGLAAAHGRKIIHRDIKPSNVILTNQGLAKIVDFGLAQMAHVAGANGSVLAGTAAYMSPEQALGKELDHRTDLWSLGVVLHEMLTGHAVFKGDSLKSVLTSVVHSRPPELPDSVPVEVQDVVSRALAESPTDRYHSATQMISALENAQTRIATLIDPGAETRTIDQYALVGATKARRKLRSRALLITTFILLVVILVAIRFIPAARDVSWRGIFAEHPAAYETYLRAAEYIQRYDKVGNLDRAIELLQSTVKTDPQFALAFASLGEAFLLKYRMSQDPKFLQEAKDNCTRALQLNAALPPVHVTMGRIQLYSGHLDLAEQTFQRAIELEPHNAEAIFGMAKVFEEQGRSKEAEELYRRAEALRPDYWDGYNKVGTFYAGQKRYAEAEAQFRHVIQLVPDNAFGYTNLAAVLIEQGKLAEGATMLEKAAQVSPSYGVYANLGQVYYRQGRYAEAAQATERALNIDDKDYRLWINLAQIRRWMNQDAQAISAYQRALPLVATYVKAHPQEAAAQAQLAELYAYSGDKNKAHAYCEAALALTSEDASVLVSVADALEAIGDHAEAVKLANKAVSKGYTSAQLKFDPEARRIFADTNSQKPRN